MPISSSIKPTVDELFYLLKKTSLPTVLVEGKNDIIFYRKIEEGLKSYGISMLPAGNKDAVLKLYERLSVENTQAEIVYIVDNDLWVHGAFGVETKPADVITTLGYSIENDLYHDGELENLLYDHERDAFFQELTKFLRWYALAVTRKAINDESEFRTHPSRVLDDPEFFHELEVGEDYPEDFSKELEADYSNLLRGKSLLALLQRQISSKQRDVKFSTKQLLSMSAARKGERYLRLLESIQTALDSSCDAA
jgi:hypothetical protein